MIVRPPIASSQICMELKRITGKNLNHEIYDNIDEHNPPVHPGQRLMKLVKQLE
ncbi:uncharacterized protein DAT39_012599, partial [Clarias magur]